MLLEKQFLPQFFQFGCANLTKAERLRFQNETYRAYWNGTMNKLLDLLDTVFFVLTKKQNHITFLHVQHHAAAAAVLWTVAKYYSGKRDKSIITNYHFPKTIKAHIHLLNIHIIIEN